HLLVDGSGRLDMVEGGPNLQKGGGVAGFLLLDDAEFYWKVPFVLGLGLAYTKPQRFTLAVDVKIHGSVDSYAIVRHPDLYPDYVPRNKRNAIANFNIGGELYLGKRWAMQGGFFTNFTSYPALTAGSDGSEDFIHLFGITTGVTFHSSETSTLSLVVQGQLGRGDTIAQEITPNNDPQQPLNVKKVLAKALDMSLVLSIGGSFDLR
ncbi:MAG: hypothetical protein V1754_11640, partial [Pseudomonadota bacterium]